MKDTKVTLISKSMFSVATAVILFAGCGTDTNTDTSTDIPTTSIEQTNEVVNHAPVATFDKFMINRDVSYDGQLTATDVDGDALAYVIVTQPSHGTVVIYDNGCFTYTPDDGYEGTDSFSYRATDDLSACAVKTVTVEVNAPIIQTPTAPSDLTVTALSSTSLQLTWDDNSDNEEGFVIYKDGRPICTTNENVTTFIVSC